MGSQLRGLNRSTTNILSACRIAKLALNDAMILPYDVNLGRIEFSERTPIERTQLPSHQLLSVFSVGLNK
jgi:hypothetical protein